MEPMILVLSPHGDDAELAMGGTMKKLSSCGREVLHVIMTTTGYLSSEKIFIGLDQRQEEARRAAIELGVGVEFGPFTDNQLSYSIDEIVSFVDALLNQYQPKDVYTCLPWFNTDHTALYQASLAAMRKVRLRANWWGYELPMQHLGFQVPEHGWRYVPLKDEHQTAKINALAQYHSQNLSSRADPVSSSGAMLLGMVRGSECGVQFAERQLLLKGVRDEVPR